MTAPNEEDHHSRFVHYVAWALRLGGFIRPAPNCELNASAAMVTDFLKPRHIEGDRYEVTLSDKELREAQSSGPV